MSKYLNDYNLHVLTNVISGVQTSGRYSDERNWGCFTEAYNCTPNEHSITLGWASNYGEKARKLLQMILEDYPEDFKKNDTAGIAEDIKKPFTTKPYYQVKKNSKKGKSIIAIITSEGGKKTQDKLFQESIEATLDNAIAFGINRNNIKALMMWCQIEHLGGPEPVKRIFRRCGTNPTMVAIMSALKKDKENGNTAEVGDEIFQSRHDKCYAWINEYCKSQDEQEKKEVSKTMINFNSYYGKISNSGGDERGKATGGKAGDQTGNEWCIRSWYNRPWDCVLRYPKQQVRQLIAELGIEAAKNDLIGYDQNERYTYWDLLKTCGYRPANIKQACEADCSAGVIANTKAAGYLLNIPALKNLNATYTGNMRAGFKKAGFQVLTASKYLSGYDYLMPGDILLNDVHHTATNLGIGKKVSYTPSEGTTPTPPQEPVIDYADYFDKSLSGKYTVNASDGLNLRTGPNKDLIVNIPNGKEVICYGYYSEDKDGKWLYVIYDKYKGFCLAKYLKVQQPQQQQTKEEEPQKPASGSTLSFEKKYTGVVTAEALWVRQWAGKEYEPLKSVPIIYKDEKVDICDDTVKASDGTIWYFALIRNEVYGFVSSSFIKKI